MRRRAGREGSGGRVPRDRGREKKRGGKKNKREKAKAGRLKGKGKEGRGRREAPTQDPRPTTPFKITLHSKNYTRGSFRGLLVNK